MPEQFISLTQSFSDGLNAAHAAAKALDNTNKSMMRTLESGGAHFKTVGAGAEFVTGAFGDLSDATMDIRDQLDKISADNLKSLRENVDKLSDAYKWHASMTDDWSQSTEGAHLRTANRIESIQKSATDTIVSSATRQSQTLSDVGGGVSLLTGNYRNFKGQLEGTAKDMMKQSEQLSKAALSAKLGSAEQKAYTKASMEAASASKALGASAGTMAAQLAFAVGAIAAIGATIKMFTETQQLLRDELRETGLSIAVQDDLYTAFRQNMLQAGFDAQQSAAIFGAVARTFGDFNAALGAGVVDRVTQISVVLGVSAQEAADLVYSVENVYKMGKGAGAGIAAGMMKAAELTKLTREEAAGLFKTMKPLIERYFMAADPSMKRRAVASMQAVAGALADVGGNADELSGAFNKMFDLTNAEGLRMRAMFSGTVASMGADIGDLLKKGDFVTLTEAMAKEIGRIPNEQYQRMKSTYSQMYGLSEQQMDDLRKLTPERIKLMAQTEKEIAAAMEDAAPLQDAYRKAMETMNTELRKLRIAFGNVFAFIGKSAMLVLTPIVKVIGTVLGWIGKLVGALERIPIIGKAIVNVLGLLTIAATAFVAVKMAAAVPMITSALTALLPVLGAGVAGFTGFAGAALAAATGVWAVLAPLLPIIAAIAAVGAALYGVWELINSTNKSLQWMGVALGVLMGPLGWFLLSIKGMTAAFKGFWAGIQEAIGPIKEAFYSIVEPVVEAFASIKLAFGELISVFSSSAEASSGPWELVFAVFKKMGKVIGKILPPIIKTVFFPLKIILKAVANGMEALAWVMVGLKKPAEVVMDIFGAIGDIFAAGFGLEAAKNMMMDFGKDIKAFGSTIFDALIWPYKKLDEVTGGIFTRLWDMIKSKFGSLKDLVMKPIDAIVKKIPDFLLPKGLAAYKKSLEEAPGKAAQAVAMSTVKQTPYSQAAADYTMITKQIGAAKVGGVGPEKLAVLQIQQKLAMDAVKEAATANKVPAMATGGVVKTATLAQVGEATPEAVVPLEPGGPLDEALYSALSRIATAVTVREEIVARPPVPTNLEPVVKKLDAILAAIDGWVSDQDDLPPGFSAVNLQGV